MLGDSAALGGGGGGGGGGGNGGDAMASAAAGTHETASVGRAGSNSGDDERGRIIDEGERSFGGNRWPRQETLALLRIRSDMDVAFRDASVKGPLWEEVSRKMAELGYHRNAKKCKEKFENVYKYHKRTKDGRTGKSDGKTYRFFEQLEALDNHPPTHHQSHSPLKSQPALTTGREGISTLSVTTSAQPISSVPTTTLAMPPLVVNTTVPSTTTTSIATTAPPSLPQGIVMTPSINIPILPSSYPQPTNPINFPPPPSSTANPTISFPNIPTDLLSNSSSSPTSSEETMDGQRKRKRKWKDFFERLMKEVIEKQEDLQRRFLEAIEKREHDRMAKEEAWRVQEMQRINREREILAQERSIAAAKDAAVMSFLQKIAEQQNLGQTLSNINTVQSQPPPPPQQQQSQPQAQPVPQSNMALTPVVVTAPAQVSPAPTIVVPMAQVQHATPSPATQQQQQQQQVVVPQQQVTNMEIVPKADNGGECFTPGSSSRWPKVEVQALIQLRTNLDAKYQENGPKGPLWEEISAAMKKLGYNRNAKRCKEKWENINKYFKKVKESNKKRPEDSKTCPYFHQLDALYREKNKTEAKVSDNMVAPLMVRPEQQWPPQQQENDPMDEDDEEEKEGEEDDEDEDEGGSGDGGNNYEVLPSKPASAE